VLSRKLSLRSYSQVTGPRVCYRGYQQKEMREISIRQLENLLHFRYYQNNCYFIDPVSVQSLPTYINALQRMVAVSIPRIQEIDLASFCIVDMGPYGHGACSNQNIRPGSILPYHGKLYLKSEIDDVDDMSYILALDGDLVIDAREAGNVTRFFQHLPKKEELEFYGFSDDKIKSSVQLENVSMCVIRRDKHREKVLFNEEEIIKGSPIGYSYGDEYWFERPGPVLFDRLGSEIPRNDYWIKKVKISYHLSDEFIKKNANDTSLALLQKTSEKIVPISTVFDINLLKDLVASNKEVVSLVFPVDSTIELRVYLFRQDLINIIKKAEKDYKYYFSFSEFNSVKKDTCYTWAKFAAVSHDDSKELAVISKKLNKLKREWDDDLGINSTAKRPKRNSAL